MRPIEQLILAKLRNGPVYAQSLRNAKPVVASLVARGIIRRVASPSGHKNMLEIVND